MQPSTMQRTHVKRSARMRACLTCDCVHGGTYKCTFQVSVWCRAEQTEPHGCREGMCVKEYKKETKKKVEPWWCLASCREAGGRMRGKKGRLSEGCMCEVSDGVWRPVLVPPQLLSSQPSPHSSQPVSGSLPSLPADFSLGGGEKNCPLSLWPTLAAWALPCPLDINQHTHSFTHTHTHTLQWAPLMDWALGSRIFCRLSLANDTSNLVAQESKRYYFFSLYIVRDWKMWTLLHPEWEKCHIATINKLFFKVKCIFKYIIVKMSLVLK